MSRMVSWKKRWSLLAAVVFAAALSAPSHAEVIFEENFDAQADWNTGNQYNGQECSVGNCNASWYPPNWDAFRNMKGSSSFTNPPISIGPLPNGYPDHSNGSGNKKAMIIYNESNSYNPGYWAGDGNLIKYFGPSANYKELYIRMWIRTQPNWQVQSSGTVQSKVFRMTHWRPEGDNIFQVANENSPIFFWDWGAWNGQAIYMPAYRCDATPYVASGTTQGRSADYYCSNLDAAHNYQKGDYGKVWSTGGPTTKFADGNWHRYDFHLKMNDIGVANGILEWSYDGQLVLSQKDVIWKEPSASAATGWNNVWFGGNSNNAFGNYVDQWYAIDDIVVSTTALPGDYVIGGAGSTDTAAPSVSITAPATSATISGTYSVTATASDNVAVTKVEFYRNGVLQATDTSAPYLYSWNTASVANGAYTLTAKAYDAAGNIAQSAAVTASVNNVAGDVTPPAVAITSPAAGATVSGAVTVAAGASDNVGVNRVEFYDNGTLFAAVNAAPYSVSYRTTSVPNGARSFTAKAYDAAGNIGQSPAVSVTVSNATPDTVPPVAAFAAPASGATVSGTASVSISASDNVSVSKVELYANGVLVGTDTSSPYAFSWGTAGVADGISTLTAKAYDAAGNMGQSSISVTVRNAVASTSTLWASTARPATVDVGPKTAQELGVKFKSDVAGYITGIRFYKASTNIGPHVAHLWSSTGRLLATATFTNETASGWQQVNFANPVAIAANTVYVASYHTRTGHYSVDRNYFSTKGVDNAPLHAAANAGVFRYTSTGGFPNQVYAGSNYWVDVVFRR